MLFGKWVIKFSLAGPFVFYKCGIGLKNVSESNAELTSFLESETNQRIATHNNIFYTSK